ncbi:DUF2185 domain-containing protein [candidate division TA06 bacterium]|nr:DUF2185 domain-containing protein [candidate division TA06 bacterium]
MTKWPFNDKPNTAVFTTKDILDFKGHISFVCRDLDDGAWQFLTGKQVDENDAAIVSLQEILEIDPTLIDILDLPIGWKAVRNKNNADWQRSPNN